MLSCQTSYRINNTLDSWGIAPFHCTSFSDGRRTASKDHGRCSGPTRHRYNAPSRLRNLDIAFNNASPWYGSKSSRRKYPHYRPTVSWAGCARLRCVPDLWTASHWWKDQLPRQRLSASYRSIGRRKRTSCSSLGKNPVAESYSSLTVGYLDFCSPFSVSCEARLRKLLTFSSSKPRSWWLLEPITRSEDCVEKWQRVQNGGLDIHIPDFRR